jgi:hypothetical protein
MKNIQLKILKFHPIFPASIRLLFALLCLLHASNLGALPLERIKLPPEFEIDIYATNVPGARSMTLSPNCHPNLKSTFTRQMSLAHVQ